MKYDLSDITVVVPSFSRQNYLKRQALYWSQSNAQVLIVDGSPEAADRSFFDPFDNIRYLHSPTQLYDRLNQAAAAIETNFAVLLGDDEFHLFSGLWQAKKRLEEELAAGRNVVGCAGQSMRVAFDHRAKKARFGLGYDLCGYEIKGEDARHRLSRALSNYRPATCHALLTRECWQMTWGSVQPWSCTYAFELQQAIATYLLGEFISTQHLCLLRSVELEPVSINNFDRELTFSKWWEGKEYEFERTEFVDGLSKLVIDREEQCSLNARDTIIDAVQAYVRNNLDSRPSALKIFLAGFARRLEKSDRYRLLNALFLLKSFIPGTRAGKNYSLLKLNKVFSILNSQAILDSAEVSMELLKIELLLSQFYSGVGKS